MFVVIAMLIFIFEWVSYLSTRHEMGFYNKSSKRLRLGIDCLAFTVVLGVSIVVSKGFMIMVGS